jgi:predicted aldo/keto reductase-like oxidoreductase
VALFEDLLRRLGTDYVDVLMVQWVDKVDEYDAAMTPDGLYAVAARLREQGKARLIGMSGHKTETALMAVRSGAYDLIMQPVNLASRAISTPFRRGFVAGEKRALLHACAQHEVPVIAMKVFWGGKLLQPGKGVVATPVQCLHYALSQPGVGMALAGVSKAEEVEALAAYADASAEAKDYAAIVAAQQDLEQVVEGCVYCNHCLPCPSDIDIALVNRLGDTAEQHLTQELRAAYAALASDASDCVACEACSERCPFGVDVVTKMERTRELFGG